MSLALLFHYLMLNMFRILIHPFSGACDLFVELFHGLYCSGLMCVGVTLWFGWGSVVSVYRLKLQQWADLFFANLKQASFKNFTFYDSKYLIKVLICLMSIEI